MLGEHLTWRPELLDPDTELDRKAVEHSSACFYTWGSALGPCATFGMKARGRSLVGAMPISDSYTEQSLAEGLMQVNTCLADSGGGCSAQQQG